MVNFIEECPKAILLPYMEPYCAKLEQVLLAKIQEVSTFRKASLWESAVVWPFPRFLADDKGNEDRFGADTDDDSGHRRQDGREIYRLLRQDNAAVEVYFRGAFVVLPEISNLEERYWSVLKP